MLGTSRADMVADFAFRGDAAVDAQADVQSIPDNPGNLLEVPREIWTVQSREKFPFCSLVKGLLARHVAFIQRMLRVRAHTKRVPEYCIADVLCLRCISKYLRIGMDDHLEEQGTINLSIPHHGCPSLSTRGSDRRQCSSI